MTTERRGGFARALLGALGARLGGLLGSAGETRLGRALVWLAARPLDGPHARGPVDALVVLGAALAPDGSLGPALAERVEAGVAAYLAGLAPALVMTGAREAEAMRRRAREAGVPDEAIWLEPTALTTRENAERTAALLRARRARHVLIVTQPYHRRRSVAAFRRVGVEAGALAFASRRTRPRHVLREYVAIVVYSSKRWI